MRDDAEHDPNAPPLNPLPPIVVALAVFILGVELVFQAGEAGLAGGPEATGWRIAALERWGFYQPLMNWMIENRLVEWEYMARFVTYPFVHGSFTHAAMALVFVLALGKMVGEVFSALAFATVYFGATVAGAVAYGLVWDTQVLLFGAYPPAFGLIGAFTFLLWSGLKGEGIARRAQAFTMIAVFMGLQLVFGLMFGASKDWVADLAGFVTGFGLSFVVSPGGWGQVLARLRRR
jgi:rhomboid protease GluP